MEGGEGQVVAKIIQSREKGQIRTRLEHNLKGGKQIWGEEHLTIATRFPNPAERLLPIQYSVK